jgi:hypothetical protein
MASQLSIIDDLPSLRPHPAAYPAGVLDALRRLVPRGVVLDVFGGTGRIGRLGPGWTAISSELELEWAMQGYRNRCALCVVADARCLPFSVGSIPAIATSPAYGNRMADTYVPPEESRRSDQTRRTYRISLGRNLSSGSAGGMQWGRAYRELHAAVWSECFRVLWPGGTLVVNCKDHFRSVKNGGQRGQRRQNVCAWHWETLAGLGFERMASVDVPVRGDRNTVRYRSRGKETIDHEEVVAWRKP